MHQEPGINLPESKWVNYARPADYMPQKPPAFQPKSVNSPNFSLARFVLDAPVLPLVTDTLPLAERVRYVIMAQFQRSLHRREFGHAEKPYRQLFRSPVLRARMRTGAGCSIMVMPIICRSMRMAMAVLTM